MRNRAAAALAFLIGAVMVTQAIAAERGPVTDLPLPRYVSLKAVEGNARRGPGMDYRVDWVFRHRSMPLRVTAEHGHWRRVEGSDGVGGWMHYALLSGVRTVRVEEEMTPLYMQADTRAPLVAYLEKGAIARLMQCSETWCRLNAQGTRGWARRAALWGVDAHEIVD